MKIYYKFLNHIISLDFPIEIPLIQLKQHIPSIQKSETIEKVDVSIQFINNSIPNLKYNFQALVIFDKWSDDFISEVPHLIYSYLKYVFFHKNIYFIHSCLINNHIFVGHSGSGKTTLCIEAMQQNIPIYSLDKTCVYIENNKLFYLDGTDILSVRKENKQPNLLTILSNDERNIYSLSINKHPLHIEYINLFQISNDINKISIDKTSMSHQLIPFFMDVIKTDFFNSKGNLIFSPKYNDINKIKLFNDLKMLNISTHFLSGTSATLISEIKDLL